MRKFELFGSIEDWKLDSMLHDSGQSVCELKDGDFMAEIRVEGDVRVSYKEGTYRTPGRFPKELQELFRKGEADSHPDVCIDMNNWYEMLVFQKGANSEEYNYIGGDLVDFYGEELTEKSLEELCQEWIDLYAKEEA